MWEAIWSAISSSGPIIGLMAAVVLVGAVLEWWVWGYVHRRVIHDYENELKEIRAEKDYWREKTFTVFGLGEGISRVASEIAEEAT